MSIAEEFNTSRFYLGKLCVKSQEHEWCRSQKTLRYRCDHKCVLCKKEWRKGYKYKKQINDPTEIIDEEYYLGKLCPQGHSYKDTNKSLRRINRGCCVQCHREESLHYHHNNKDTRHINMQNYRLNNKDKIREQRNNYRAKNKENIARQNKEWFEKMYADPARKEKYLLQQRQYYQKHKVRKLAQNKKWLAENQERIKAYWKSDRGKAVETAAKHKRRIRKAKNHSYLVTTADIEKVKQYFGNACAYCGNTRDLTIDHFLPISVGGPHCLGNLVIACGSCNSRKKASDPKEWYEAQPFYSHKRWLKILKFLGKSDYRQIPLL